jgi:hypothetical protein
MNETAESLVRVQVKGRLVTYYLVTESDLEAVRSNSVLGDLSTALLGISAGGVVSAIVARTLGVNITEQAASSLQVLLIGSSVFTFVFLGSVWYFLSKARTAVQRIKDAGPSAVVGSSDLQLKTEPATVGAVSPTRGGLEILSATYWTAQHRLDVTTQLREKVANNRLDTAASNAIAGDPHEGVLKTLTILYSVDGLIARKDVLEGDAVTIP